MNRMHSANFSRGDSIAVTAYVLDRSATRMTACVTMSGVTLMTRMVAHMVGVGGVSCRTSAIGAR